MSVSPSPGQPITGDWFQFVGDSLGTLAGHFEGNADEDAFGLNEIEAVVHNYSGSNAFTTKKNRTLAFEFGRFVFSRTSGTTTTLYNYTNYQTPFESTPYLFIQPIVEGNVTYKQIATVIRFQSKDQFRVNAFLVRDGSQGTFSPDDVVRANFVAIGWKEK